MSSDDDDRAITLPYSNVNKLITSNGKDASRGWDIYSVVTHTRLIYTYIRTYTGSSPSTILSLSLFLVQGVLTQLEEEATQVVTKQDEMEASAHPPTPLTCSTNYH